MIVLLVILLLVGIIVLPIITLWMLNTLCNTQHPFDIEHWVAALVLSLVIVGMIGL